MARLVHVERDQVRAACATFEKLLANDPIAQRKCKEFERSMKAEKAQRDKEFAATQPKSGSDELRTK
jgi:hypothetical protein